jgi:signal transduction histidine kinase/signal recognition particle receptor subunit beta
MCGCPESLVVWLENDHREPAVPGELGYQRTAGFAVGLPENDWCAHSGPVKHDTVRTDGQQPQQQIGGPTGYNQPERRRSAVRENPMVQFDNQARNIKVKIVYYGPALGGKTTCLQQIHQVIDPNRRTKLYSLNTANDRTLFFDLLSLDLGRIRGYGLALQLYTVPGQVQYNATRRAVLAGADGLVFVADSQQRMLEANVRALENLKENLLANGLTFEGIPLVLQYNKRDLSPVMAVEELESVLNSRQVPAFPSVAISGEGVMEGFSAITEMTLESVADKLGVGAEPELVQRLQHKVKQALQPFLGAGGEGRSEDVSVLRPASVASTDDPLTSDDLVQEAVRANLEMTDLNAQLDILARHLERNNRGLAGIAEFGQAVGTTTAPGDVLRLLLKTAGNLLRVQAGAVLVVPGSGQLREAVLHGFRRDPLLATPDEAGEPLALAVVEERTPRLISPDSPGRADDPALAAIESAGLASAVAVPMIARERVVGLLTVYRTDTQPAFDEDDLQLASVLGATAAVSYSNASAWGRLEELNKDLEAQVASRTEEVRASLDEVERMAADLRDKNALLEDAYRELSELDRVKNELISRVSGDLEGPVGALFAAAKIIGRYAGSSPEKTERFAGVIAAEAQRLSDLIQSIGQASALASVRGEARGESVGLADLLKKVMAPLRDLTADRDVSLQVRIPSGLTAIHCDGKTMEAALRAVIRNAIEFSRPGGEVRVEVRRQLHDDQQWLVVRVVDTGIGIPESDLPHVGESFWRGDGAAERGAGGMGLGLAIARRVMESHGGRLEIRSVRDEGSEVSLHLPQGGV